MNRASSKVRKRRQITVGIGAVIESDRILFVRRHAPTVAEYHQKWELPGGKIEIGEAVEAAIEREVEEETGVRVECTDLLPFSFSRALHTRTDDLHVIVLCARCHVRQGIGTGTRKVPVTAPHWIRVGDIPFDEVIPGSREFLIWCLHATHGSSIPDNATIYEMDMQCVDGSKDKYRHYRVVLSFHPSEEFPFRLVRQWGRIGHRLSQRSESFRRMDQALSAAQKVVSTRQAHGYDLTYIQDNHPLRSWLETRDVPLGDELRSDTPLQLQLLQVPTKNDLR